MRITWEEWLSEQAKGMGNIARSLSPSLLSIKHYIFINRALVHVNTCATLPCGINTDQWLTSQVNHREAR
jgi:hypothetical protein